MEQMAENWSGKEDSNLRPLPPEGNAYASNPQESVGNVREAAERAANGGMIRRNCTGVAPDAKPTFPPHRTFPPIVEGRAGKLAGLAAFQARSGENL